MRTSEYTCVCASDIAAIQADARAQLSREWDLMRGALKVIAREIGSTHAATKAKEALKALRNEHTS